ncbi:ATP-binding protein [Streptomyces sp. NPDC050085]|uniref:ATP-binding protein n=1 Tax=Streptomyces sp. NPDC050085 TaxID=3365600 RepID=UPI0037B706F0
MSWRPTVFIVPAARRCARQALAGWGLAAHERSDDVLLCVSEPATNALLHGVPPGRGYRLQLSYGGGVLRVEVQDSGPGTPRMRKGGDGVGGRACCSSPPVRIGGGGGAEPGEGGLGRVRVRGVSGRAGPRAPGAGAGARPGGRAR